MQKQMKEIANEWAMSMGTDIQTKPKLLFMNLWQGVWEKVYREADRADGRYDQREFLMSNSLSL